MSPTRLRAGAALLLASLVGCSPPPPVLSPSALPPTAAALASRPAAPVPTSQAEPTIDPRAVRPAAISSRIRFLADDLLEGRFTGSRGHAIAERYVASELQSLGAEPAGDGGTFFQSVPLRGATKDFKKTSLVLHSHGKPDLALKLDDDFVLSSDLRTANVDVDAPLVFAGFGVTAPEYGYDDLGSLDVKGKIVLVLRTSPLSDKDDFFPPIAHAIYSDANVKVARLSARGALGVLQVFRPEDEEIVPWPRVGKAARIEQMDWVKAGELGTSAPGATLRGLIHWKAFDTLLARAGLKTTTASLLQDAEKRALKPFEIPASLHGKLASKLRDLESHNVVGVLRGSDPKLSSEYVVYSAHLDHLGVGDPVGGDAIYNGAVDNASGTAGILEIAHAFSLLPKRPARSILFLACTGEERGLLGSDYFARYPTVPVAAIVADFNDDMVVALGPVHDVVALGEQHSTLGPLVRDAARSLGLETSPDPEPKQLHFIRSDQFSFVKQGIPSIVVESGLKDEAGHTEAYEAKRKEWRASHYHQPKDEWEPGYDYEGMAQVARVALLAGFAVATAPERPAWGKGDFLGTKYARP